MLERVSASAPGSRLACQAVDEGGDVVIELPHPEALARRLRFDNPNARQTCGCGESFGT